MRERNDDSCPEEVLRYYRQAFEEEKARVVRGDSVARECTRVFFVSKSKGRGRRRGKTKEVELICRGGRCVQVVDGQGPFDEWATEILGDSVPSDEVEREFLRRVRQLGR